MSLKTVIVISLKPLDNITLYSPKKKKQKKNSTEYYFHSLWAHSGYSVLYCTPSHVISLYFQSLWAHSGYSVLYSQSCPEYFSA